MQTRISLLSVPLWFFIFSFVWFVYFVVLKLNNHEIHELHESYTEREELLFQILCQFRLIKKTTLPQRTPRSLRRKCGLG